MSNHLLEFYSTTILMVLYLDINLPVSHVTTICLFEQQLLSPGIEPTSRQVYPRRRQQSKRNVPKIYYTFLNRLNN